MTSFTAAYLLRLAMWGLAFAMFLGGPVWAAWRLRHRTLRRASAAARHRSAGGHLLALLILPIAMVGSVHLTLAGMGTEISRGPLRTQMWSVGYGRDAGWLASIIVTVWLLGALLAAFRLARDAWQLRRLRLEPAGETLADEVRLLGRRLPGRRGQLTVRVADVPAPQVLGVVRPVLVAPPGLLHLSAAEREAVLLHELAHVARRDFTANLRQRLVLVALWFQPAAWALYGHLCREREACCDRLAVQHGASATALARALVRLAESRARPPLALAIAGRGDLGWRVNLLLAPEGSVPTSRHWQAPVLGALALALSGLGGAWLSAADGAVSDLYIASALGPVVSVRARDPAGSFGLRILRGRVLEATVEGQRLSQTSIRQRGGHVALLGARNETVVSFRVTPHGRIEWQARVAGRPRS